MALHEHTLCTLRDGIAAGEMSAEAATEAYLARIDAHDGALHSYLHVDREGALSQARAVDAARQAGKPLGPLAGVPVSVKDNLCTDGLPTTCASRMLEGYRPPYDAHVVERLRDAGAVILGKANLDEFAMGSSTEHSAYGVTRNPWDTARVPGGSSGGSAASVAGRLACASLGSDTGGSVRQPAAFCGVTALKPTYGRVSRYGLVAFASSLDQVGPITRDARDAAALMDVIAGHDPRDATSIPEPADTYGRLLGQPLRGLKVGVLAGESMEGLDGEVRAQFALATERLAELGCELSEVTLPHLRHAVSVYYIVGPAEASSNLARFDGMRYGLRVSGSDLNATYAETRAAGFGEEVKRRIMLGTYALSAGYFDAYYLKAQRVRTLIRQDYDAAFASCDVIASPTTPTPAFRLGEHTGDPLAMYLADLFTLPAPLAGLPALSTPSGLTQGGLPLGLHLTGPALSEPRLLQVADAYEREHGLREAPPMADGQAAEVPA